MQSPCFALVQSVNVITIGGSHVDRGFRAFLRHKATRINITKVYTCSFDVSSIFLVQRLSFSYFMYEETGETLVSDMPFISCLFYSSPFSVSRSLSREERLAVRPRQETEDW